VNRTGEVKMAFLGTILSSQMGQGIVKKRQPFSERKWKMRKHSLVEECHFGRKGLFHL
jgi:hypothetical protein